MVTFKSTFARHMVDYIRLRRALGFKLESQGAVLRRFDAYVCPAALQRPAHAGPRAGLRNGQLHRVAYRVLASVSVRAPLAEYLVAFDPATPRLDPKALRRISERPPVHIYTDAELTVLLREARLVSPKYPFRGLTLRAMIGLAAATGLRIGEVVRLDKDDVDLERGVLTILRTKFKKDRLVPMHPTVVVMLRGYLVARDAACRSGSPAFFISLRSNRFARHTVEGSFCAAAQRAGLRGPTGKGPSFHGLRHRFAVRRLVAWYQEGVDVQAMLPALATYLGHVRYSDTAYYLTATSELMALAAARYHRSLPRREAEA